MHSLFANEHTNIKYAIMFDSLMHNFARVDILRIYKQKDVGTKHTYLIVYNGRICINRLKY